MRLLAKVNSATRHFFKRTFSGDRTPQTTTEQQQQQQQQQDVDMSDTEDKNHLPHQVHHDYTWLTKATAKSHTLREIVKQFNCSEHGAKNALTRRGITECKDFIHSANAWKPKEPPKKKHPKEHEVEEVVGKRTFEDGSTQYKIKWKEFDEDHCTWEPPSHLDHAKQAGTRGTRL